MDGYTFMLARNRRLIAAEVASNRPLTPAPPADRGASARPPVEDPALRPDIVTLYRQLEGCGR